ncbi:hypothetical protein BKA70DRAFT_1240474 [Coprinopsis sp. MPI-PUGE-AT-0042]|nr:hypothetical protein BKA70DRAFT_1240474 [Coprinopsis sp. MPI-PUGE-AT-0042]
MGSKAEALGLLLTEAEVQRKVIYLVAIWAETSLYGLYFCLFIGVVTVFAQKEVHKPFASKVFLAGNILMFIAISLHNGLSVYRLVTGFAYQLDARASLLYLDDLRNWAAVASPFVLVVIMWTGDALLIYRCFLIWQRNYKVIVIPSLLYILIVGLEISNIWWIARQSTLVDVNAKRWPILRITFPLYFAQNLLNTGLILFRLGSRHRDLQSAGIVSLNTPSLVGLMRAIVESAAIYTAALLALVVLCSLDHPGWYVSELILYPTTGIMFMLMAVRVHRVQEQAKHTAPSPSLLPSWIMGDQEQIAQVTTTSRGHRESNSSTITKGDTSRALYEVEELHQPTTSRVERN